MTSLTPTAKVINPSLEDLKRILDAASPDDVLDLLEKLDCQNVDILQINVPAEAGPEITQYAYDGKLVIKGTVDDFGTVHVKEMHEELFKF